MRLVESFTADVPKDFVIPGDFFLLESAPAGLVDVRFFRGGARVAEGELLASTQGWKSKPKGGYDRVEIISSVTQAIAFHVVKGEVDVNTFSGSIVGAVSVQGPRALSSGPVLADLPVLVRDVGFVYGVSFVSLSPLTLVVSQEVVAPAANVNGLTIWAARARSSNAVAVANIQLQAHTAPPNSGTVGDFLAICANSDSIAGIFNAYLMLDRPVFVPAGKGVYFTVTTTESSGARHVVYTLH